MRRQQLPSKSNNSKIQTKNDVMIRQNTATLYGIYFATSNTDFLLKEKKTRFSVRPSVILNEDRKTVIFDYSAVKGTDESSIFDGFFRGISVGVTLTVDGGIETTCNFINETNGVPITNFADTYTIVKIDVDKKIIIATKETGISSTTAVVFPGNYFINLPQFTKTTVNESSTPIRKILNLLPSQSLSHLGIMSGSILEFKKTSKNNSKFTVKSIYTENGIECIEVEEPITQEDATQNQIIMSVYGEEPITEGSSAPPVLPAPIAIAGIQINSCCPLACMDCLFQAIRLKESGGNARNGCDAINRDDGGVTDDCTGARGENPTPADKKKCWACGPYQIKYEYFDAAQEPAWNQPDAGACRSLKGLNWENELCKPCTGSEAEKVACCQRKETVSRLIMTCWWRRFTRNGGCQSGQGPCKTINRDGNCFTCEDLARSHNRGPCGHDPNWDDRKPANGPPPERPYRESTPYWEVVKTNMCELGGQCSNCCDANYNCKEFSRPNNLYPSTPLEGSCGCAGDPEPPVQNVPEIRPA
jgi:hypothetical protein